MFQRLDELQTGSLYILTGLAGAGKSHLACGARKGGTLWILDTEGAAQNMSGKPGIHRRIQVMQSISLRMLINAMEEIRSLGKPGDTIVLDSISKVFQAMRAHAQRRAGADTDRKTGIAFDEYASVNRNMQAVYTALTELKQAGFHVIIIGHLSTKYRQQSDGALADEGLRVLADDQITYEADAILLVEREGEERLITPIIKPPRPAHLKFGKRYAATLGTLYPDLVPEADAKGKRKGSPEPRSTPIKGEPDPELEAPEAIAPDAEPAHTEDTDLQAATPAATTAAPAPAQHNLPRDAAEAERRFFARYGEIIGGDTWNDVQRYLGKRTARPSTVEGWIAAAEAVRTQARTPETPAAITA
jgi:hypothetical protein